MGTNPAVGPSPPTPDPVGSTPLEARAGRVEERPPRQDSDAQADVRSPSERPSSGQGSGIGGSGGDGALAQRSVLNVLAHPGGGGETYVDTLARMRGWRSRRVFLSSSPRSAPLGVARAGLAGFRSDLVHAHGEVAALLSLPTLSLRPSVVTLHGLHLVRRLEGHARRAAAANLRLVVRTADRTICAGESERDHALLVVGDALAERLVVIRHGVDLPPPGDRAEARSSLGVDEPTAVVLFLGSLEAQKDPLAAARAVIDASRQAPVMLVLAGEGPLRPVLEAFGDPVRVLGERHDVGRLLAAADIFLLPSRREGIPFALLEAMAAGLPCIVCDEPGCIESVGEAGLVVAGGDLPALSAAVVELAGDRSRGEELGRLARERVERLFRAETMIATTQALYDELAG